MTRTQTQTAPVANEAPLLEMRNIKKNFGAVKALKDASLSVRAGEVHALVGGNGAGKSTIVSILSGVYQPDGGEITFHGAPIHIHGPKEARALGIATIHQDLSLVDTLDVAANLYLGNEIIRGPKLGWLSLMNKKKMREEGGDAFRNLGVSIPNVRSVVARMSGGQRQAIACTRSMMGSTPTLLIMDEPTAALGVRETAEVYELMRRCRDGGAAILLISHDMEEVFEVTDRITVMRLGRTVTTLDKADVTSDQIVGLITGSIESL